MRTIGSRLVAITAVFVIFGVAGCGKPSTEDSQKVLEKFFSSAVRQDYAAAYDCYYGEYRKKVTQDEYVSHRRQGAALKSYRIISLERSGNSARATVLLTFVSIGTASGHGEQKEVVVAENLTKEDGDWKIRVWN